MKITYRTAMEVVAHEAIVRQAYKDSVGVWTWSVGLTSATGHQVERYIGKPQSLTHCLRVYAWALDNYADAVRDVFKGVKLTEEQFAAALSFHWNTGQIRKASWVKSFKAGNLKAAKQQFMNYSKPPEIIPRRKAERDLFFDGKWTGDGTCTEWTRVGANGRIDWKSGKRINIEAELKAAMAGDIPASDKVITEVEKHVTPPAVKKVVEDAAADDRTSTTEVVTTVTGIGGIAAALKPAFDAIRDGAETIMSMGPWLILAIVLGGGAFYIWRERRRKRNAARKASEGMG